MKSIVTAAALSAALVTSQAHAGGMAAPMMEPEIIVEESASSSGGFIVPLILLGLVALAIANDDDDSPPVAVSDVRIKTDIVQVGTTNFELPLYHFRYFGIGPVFEGVMAQDVQMIRPDAVILLEGGMLSVDYARLGLEMRRID